MRGRGAVHLSTLTNGRAGLLAAVLLQAPAAVPAAVRATPQPGCCAHRRSAPTSRRSLVATRPAAARSPPPTADRCGSASAPDRSSEPGRSRRAPRCCWGGCERLQEPAAGAPVPSAVPAVAHADRAGSDAAVPPRVASCCSMARSVAGADLCPGVDPAAAHSPPGVQLPAAPAQERSGNPDLPGSSLALLLPPRYLMAEKKRP